MYDISRMNWQNSSVNIQIFNNKNELQEHEEIDEISVTFRRPLNHSWLF